MKNNITIKSRRMRRENILNREQLNYQCIVYSSAEHDHIYFSFALMQKKQKIKAEKMTALSCHAALLKLCTTVNSAVVLYS
jgi:hypothetical protein